MTVARHAGRPTRDTLFADVNRDGVTALKVWNRNTVTGVLGLFNAQGSRWDRATRKFVGEDDDNNAEAVTATLRASDIEGLLEGRQAVDAQAEQAVGVVVPTRPAAMPAAYVPVAHVAAGGDGTVALYSYRAKELRVVRERCHACMHASATHIYVYIRGMHRRCASSARRGTGACRGARSCATRRWAR